MYTLGEQLGSQVQWYLKAGGIYPDPNRKTVSVSAAMSGTVAGVTTTLNSTGGGPKSSLTQTLSGASLDIYVGNPGTYELGGGSRHLGAGVTLNSSGKPVGIALHIGVSKPSLPAYSVINLD